MTIDADAFPTGTASARTGPAAEPTPERHEDVPRPVAIVFPSRSDGIGHVVTIDASGAMGCTCEAAALGHRRCWAMRRTAELLKLGD